MSNNVQMDAGTEVLQLWVVTFELQDQLIDKVRQRGNGESVPTTGVRSGLDQEITGLLQILRLAQAYTLEIAIKALYMKLNPTLNPQATHYLMDLFDSLSRGVKNKLRAKWAADNSRSPVGQGMTLDEFLNEYRSMFEDSRYLFEGSSDYAFNTNDFHVAIGLFVLELTPEDQELTANLVNALGRRTNVEILDQLGRRIK